MRSTAPLQVSSGLRLRTRFGRLGVWLALAGTVVTFSLATAPQAAAATAAQISAGGFGTCALTTEGGVKCWGAPSTLTPVDVPGLESGVAQISAGGYHVCALTTGGGVKCWGLNDHGQLGDGTTTNRSTPVDVVGLASGVVQVSAGFLHTCALMTGGSAKCWGLNSVGELGDGTTTDRFTPVDVSVLTSSVAQITAGGYHTCVLSTGGGVKCWGLNGFGQLGDGTTTDRATPVDVSGLTSGVAQISVSAIYTCALTTGGQPKCWGDNQFGELGDGTKTQSSTPVDVLGLASGVVQVSAGFLHTCALMTGGGATCWGYNNAGQLGDGTATNRPAPVDVSGLSAGVAQISPGGYHTCALTTEGGVKCWGSNDAGQLGNGTRTSSPTPVDVSDFVVDFFQPDVLIKRSSASIYVGDDIYNGTGQDQGTAETVVAGSSASLNIKIQNDGNVHDAMSLVGCSSSSGFVVKYTARRTDITANVVAGTQVTRTLPAGRAYRFTLRIRARLAAAPGASKVCQVTATSVAAAAKQDTVSATLTVQSPA